MKKFLSLSLIILLMISIFIPSSSFAASNISSDTFTLDEYNELVKTGAIGEDVSYEALKSINEQSKTFEESFENSSNFTAVPFTTRTLKAGDILVTNATSYNGLVGHAAIALSPYQILHIAGIGESVTTLTPETFKTKYSDGWIKVYRMNNSTAGAKAAKWAAATYKDSLATYRITTDLSTTHETYCSKIVWQAYYYGVGKNVVAPFAGTYQVVPPYELASRLSAGDYTTSLLGDL